MINSLCKIRHTLKKQHPLVHCITNPISITQCANAILAVGGRPIMAEHPGEVQEITQTAGAVMLNLGNITDMRMEAMQISARTATEHKTPVLLDLVGIACSRLRRDFSICLLQKTTPAVIKGNYSEINALFHQTYRSSGVDADASLDVAELDQVTVHLARSYSSVVLASGKVDIITDGTRLFHVKNGTSQLSDITGTGCMLGALTAAYLSVEPSINAAVLACLVMGIGGQLSKTDLGTGSFLTNLMDALSTVSDADLKQYMNMEELCIEEI